MNTRNIATALILSVVACGAFAQPCQSKGECKEQLATARAAVKAEKAVARTAVKAAREAAAIEKMRGQIASLEAKTAKK